METSKKDAEQALPTVALTAPVPSYVFGGTWFDLFYRAGCARRPDTWIVWSPQRPAAPPCWAPLRC